MVIPLVLATLLAADPAGGAREDLADPSVAVDWILADAPPANVVAMYDAVNAG